VAWRRRRGAWSRAALALAAWRWRGSPTSAPAALLHCLLLLLLLLPPEEPLPPGEGVETAPGCCDPQRWAPHNPDAGRALPHDAQPRPGLPPWTVVAAAASEGESRRPGRSKALFPPQSHRPVVVQNQRGCREGPWARGPLAWRAKAQHIRTHTLPRRGPRRNGERRRHGKSRRSAGHRPQEVDCSFALSPCEDRPDPSAG